MSVDNESEDKGQRAFLRPNDARFVPAIAQCLADTYTLNTKVYILLASTRSSLAVAEQATFDTGLADLLAALETARKNILNLIVDVTP